MKHLMIKWTVGKHDWTEKDDLMVINLGKCSNGAVVQPLL